jgi:hypothetical protein
MKRNFAIASILIVLLAVFVGRFAIRSSSSPDKKKLQEKLERFAWQSSWPGGALQHTPFHGGHTTRFLLLKCCLKSKVLANHLKLSDKQLATVGDLQVLENYEYSEKIGIDKLFDEESLDPEYYAFLSDEQMDRLDVLCFHLDGYSSLLRTSMKSRLQLSTESSEKISKLFSDFRTNHVNPRFRRNFAAQLPADIKYQNTWWDGSTTTFLNTKILAVLNDKEQQKLYDLLTTNKIPHDVLWEMLGICELPAGVESMYGYAELQ